MFQGISLVLLAVGLWAQPAFAAHEDVMYSYDSWKVIGYTADDGTFSCLAEVTSPNANEAFTIWAYDDGAIDLQFYSEDWDFGESDWADLEVQIDRNAPWLLTDANLKQNSVWFKLPGEEAAGTLVAELAKGDLLHLRSRDGTPVRDYSLVGSAPAIAKLLDCGLAIRTKSNPFN